MEKYLIDKPILPLSMHEVAYPSICFFTISSNLWL